jgi:eukaryotic-like serine/threonine-protein kinase
MIEMLGRGPVAEVYAVEGKAVKVFPGKFDRRTLAAIEQDRVKLAGAPVLRVDRVEVLKGRHALRMELCAESLASRVSRGGPLPSAEVAELCAVLSRGLAAAHGAGVLHGGVSPLNVLFRANGDPVLADFGVAQRQAFRRDPLYGIEWVSPETLRTGEVDTKTDMYGLGAVLHFALTGESPHPSRIGETTGERILRVLGDPVPAVSRADVPIGLSTTIGRLLAPDPTRRSAPWTEEEAEERQPSTFRFWRWAAAIMVVTAVVLAVILWPRPTPARTAATAEPGPKPVIDLAEPADLTDRVELTWTATDDRLFFAVHYWPEGEEGDTAQVGQKNTTTVPVEPGRKYCFLVRGTNGEDEVVESQARGIREAVCDR